QGKAAAAAQMLQRATETNPLPEYQWTLSEALRADGKTNEALAVEAQLRRKAATADPRTYALYLATRGELPDLALLLAEAELNSRADVFTHDALAWALASSGKQPESTREIELALGEGTKDARLFFHAALIAWRNGEREKAIEWAGEATRMR